MEKWTCLMPKVYRLENAPKFPAKFLIVSKAVLQKTDVKNNNNKYYAIELHSQDTKKPTQFRVFTHYGRTDDLDSNPDAGVKECRMFGTIHEAQRCYDAILKQKTGASKGYKELSLASSRIGSQQARGKSVGKIDDETLAKAEKKPKKKALKPKVALKQPIKSLVEYIYAEATNALTTTVNAKITADGIETPLGVLTLGQIEQGQAVLDQIDQELKKKRKQKGSLEELSSEFFTLIPHRIGRSRDAIEAAVIRDPTSLVEKNETLQLMRDMLSVSDGDEGNVLYDGTIADQYLALGCKLETVSKAEFKKWEKYVGRSIVNLYKVVREEEQKAFKESVGNIKHLFHGSNIKNWVGILSRGILMPKAVVSMGGFRTDAGWLGNGIYFGSEFETSSYYTCPGRKRTSFIAINSVALGKIKEYKKITYGINAPPKGYNSCHGNPNARGSEFDDNEFVVYNTNQQRLEYLVEF